MEALESWYMKVYVWNLTVAYCRSIIESDLYSCAFNFMKLTLMTLQSWESKWVLMTCGPFDNLVTATTPSTPSGHMTAPRGSKSSGWLQTFPAKSQGKKVGRDVGLFVLMIVTGTQRGDCFLQVLETSHPQIMEPVMLQCIPSIISVLGSPLVLELWFSVLLCLSLPISLLRMCQVMPSVSAALEFLGKHLPMSMSKQVSTSAHPSVVQVSFVSMISTLDSYALVLLVSCNLLSTTHHLIF